MGGVVLAVVAALLVEGVLYSCWKLKISSGKSFKVKLKGIGRLGDIVMDFNLECMLKDPDKCKIDSHDIAAIWLHVLTNPSPSL